MTEHVLVPIDGSPLATRALEDALEEYPDASVTALHVLDPLEGVYSAPLEATLPTHWQQWYESEQEQSGEYHERADEVAAEYGTDLTHETMVGNTPRTIVAYAADHDEIDHIVIGSHGRQGLDRLLLGSVAETVLRRAPVPVTVVR